MSKPLESWVQQRRVEEASANVGIAVAAVGLGVVVLFFTFWLAYALAWIAAGAVSAVTEMLFNMRFRIPHLLRLLLAGAFVVALCAEWLRRSVHELGSWAGERVSKWIPQSGGFGALVQLLGHPTASSKMITEILYTGPCLLTGAWALVQRSKALRHQDPTALAWLLSVLITRPNAFAYDELRALWPDADWEDLLAQARSVDGVVALEKGLGLTAELREELRRAGGSGPPMRVGGT